MLHRRPGSRVSTTAACVQQNHRHHSHCVGPARPHSTEGIAVDAQRWHRCHCNPPVYATVLGTSQRVRGRPRTAESHFRIGTCHKCTDPEPRACGAWGRTSVRAWPPGDRIGIIGARAASLWHRVTTMSRPMGVQVQEKGVNRCWQEIIRAGRIHMHWTKCGATQ